MMRRSWAHWPRPSPPGRCRCRFLQRAQRVWRAATLLSMRCRHWPCAPSPDKLPFIPCRAACDPYCVTCFQFSCAADLALDELSKPCKPAALAGTSCPPASRVCLVMTMM